MLQHLLQTHRFQLGIVTMLVDGIPDDVWATPNAESEPNHPAWQLGHMCIAADGAAMMLGAEAVSPDRYRELFARGSAYVNDPSAYPAKDELLKTLADAHANAAAALQRADQAQLAQPNPNERMRENLPTLGDMACFLVAGHEAFHAGTISAWRKARGLPRLIG